MSDRVELYKVLRTVLCGPELCLTMMRIRISIALAFCSTSSRLAFIDRCLTALSMTTRYSGSSTSQARNSPRNIAVSTSCIAAAVERTYA